jgi:hypothetical protein
MSKHKLMTKLKARRAVRRQARLLSLKTWEEYLVLREASFTEAKVIYLLPAGEANTQVPKHLRNAKGVQHVFRGDWDHKHCHELGLKAREAKIDTASQGKNSHHCFSAGWFNSFCRDNGIVPGSKEAQKLLKEIFVTAERMKLESKKLV